MRPNLNLTFLGQRDNAQQVGVANGGTAVLVHRRIVYGHNQLNTTVNSTFIDISLGQH